MKRALLFLITIVAIAASGGAQVAKVSGRVVDLDDDEPIIGATVRIDGTDKMVITNSDGRFEFSNLTAKHQKITVTYIGYESQTQQAAPEMLFRMTTHVQKMDEVIVVAFGKQKRESFTGSATVVNSGEISKQLVNNPIQALNGRVTGMQMTDNNSFSSSAMPQIRIRGFSSLNASNQPLVVLDGLPYSGYLNDINPADIESMTVLKDAASNALYGARGANGVILITTKNAQRGNTRVTLEAKWGLNTDGRQDYDVIDNPGEYYEAHYLALRNYYQYRQGDTFEQAHAMANSLLSAANTSGGLGYMVYNVPENQYLIGTNGRLNPYATLGNVVNYQGHSYLLYPDNWYKGGTRDGLRQEYNLNITGGNDRYGMLAAIGYMKNEGLARGADIERATARLKVNYQAYSFLRLGGSSGFTNTNTNNLTGVFATRYSIAPIYPLYIRDAEGHILTDEHGKRYDYGNYDMGVLRPVDLNGNVIQDDLINVNKNSSNAFNIQGYATVDFRSDLHLTVNGSVYITENRTKWAYSPYYGYEVEIGGEAEINHYRTTDNNYQQLLNYTPSFGHHSLDILVGHEYSRTTQTGVGGYKERLADYSQSIELNTGIIEGGSNSSASLYNVEGYFGRVQYDYDSRYFASGSFRRDGSSRFHPKHRWGNFWSLGAAWILTKEEWFPKSPYVNMLKLKASYGEQGNDGIGSFRYADLYNITNSNDQVAFSFSSKGNENITWETVGSFNAGLEAELFNSRLTGGVEFYRRKTTDMLMWLTTPYEIGYSGYYDNVGDMTNTGIELELSGAIVNTRDFKWNLGMNLTWQKNKIVYIPEKKQARFMEGHGGYTDSNFFYGEGLPMYTFYLKRFAGVSDEGKALYYRNVTDADGNVTLETTDRFDNANYYLCGNAMPTIFGGFNTTFNIYGVDISAMFNYSVGGKKLDYGYWKLMLPPRFNSTGAGFHRDVFDCWTPDNPTSDRPMFCFNDDTDGMSDRFLTKADFLSLRNLTVGYTLPRRLTQQLKIQELRISATCENVAYWTCRKGFDPRTSLTQGLYGGDAPMRTFSFGLKMQF